MYLFVIIGMFILSPAWSQKTWKVDPAHSNILFSVTHLVISEVEGSFSKYSGTLVANEDDFTDAVIVFNVDVNSINTNNEMRDNHLKSDDFFKAGKYPEITFKSEEFKKINDKKYEQSSELKNKEVTKKVKFNVEYKGKVLDPYGNTKAGFKATSEINRFDYGLKWNAVTEAGGAVVSQDVKIILNIQLTLQK